MRGPCRCRRTAWRVSTSPAFIRHVSFHGERRVSSASRTVGRDSERRPLARSETPERRRGREHGRRRGHDCLDAFGGRSRRENDDAPHRWGRERQREKCSRLHCTDVCRDEFSEGPTPRGHGRRRESQKQARRDADECRRDRPGIDSRFETSRRQRRRTGRPLDGGCGRKRRSRRDSVSAQYRRSAWRYGHRFRGHYCAMRSVRAVARGERRSRQRCSTEWRGRWIDGRGRVERHGQTSHARSFPVSPRSRRFSRIARSRGI